MTDSIPYSQAEIDTNMRLKSASKKGTTGARVHPRNRDEAF